MSRSARIVRVLLLGCLHGSPAAGQTLLDLGDPASVHALAARRLTVLEEARDGAARRILAVADAIGSTEPGGAGRMALLGEARELSDSLARLDEEIRGARAELTQARRQLVASLEGRAESARGAVPGAPPGERPALEAQVRALEADVAELRRAGAEPPVPHPFDTKGSAVMALADVVEEEGTRLRAAQRLQDELRLFMGYLRVFDETGVPPSARAESGGTGEPGCPATSCPTDVGGAPADLPLEHARPEGGSRSGGDAGVGLTPEALGHLHAQLLAPPGSAAVPAAPPGWAGGRVVRDLGVGLALIGFRRQGESRAGVAVRSAASLRGAWALGATSRLTVEPWVGARSVRVPSASAGEVTAELRETLDGGRENGTRWQVGSWQKGRVLTHALPVPAYLDPGRVEGGVVARVSVPFGSGWALEVGGGADAVRYEPESWEALNRQGLNGSAAVSRQVGAGGARASLLAARHAFPMAGDVRRVDTRLGVGADWSSEGRRVLRVSVAATRNDSRLVAYDYRSGRAAVALSMPLGSASVQGYGALSLLRYDHPGPEGGRLAPSDQDTGSMVALQVTRPIADSRAITLQAEWARSVTGFGSDYYHRFGASARLSFRTLGGR